MKKFIAPSLSLETPENWIDVSVYTLCGPPVDGYAPTLVVTRLIAMPGAGLDGYVDSQIRELESLREFRVIQRKSYPKLQVGPGIVVDFTWVDAEGTTFAQRQAYIKVAESVYTLTATVPNDRSQALLPVFKIILGVNDSCIVIN